MKTYNFNFSDMDNSDKWYLKDQRKLVEKCQAQDIPVFCICGNDINAIPALREYINSAEKNESGNPEFVEGLKLLLADFQEYQAENPEDIKVPD